MKPGMNVVALSMILLLSGCLGSGGDPADADTGDDPADPNTQDPGAGDGSGTDGGNGTGGTPPENQAPSATLTASVTNGSAPLNVTFELDGSDPDGDALSWSLDVDGDGEANHTGQELPASVDFAYGAPGVYVALLAVSDGEATVQASVEINVTAAAPSVAPILYLVGDGSTTVVTDPTTAQANADQPFITNKALSSAGNGNDESTYIVFPSGNPSGGSNYLLPSFIGSETVTLTGAPVTLFVYVNTLCPPNAAAATFPLHAVLMDASGAAIAPTAASFGVPGAGVSELAFTLEPEPGTYAGLQVQYGKSATSSPESPCLPFVTQWGTDDANGRLELALGDIVVPAPA